MEAKNASPHGDAFELLEQRASRVSVVAQFRNAATSDMRGERVIVLAFSVSPPVRLSHTPAKREDVGCEAASIGHDILVIGPEALGTPHSSEWF
jgi:hypothetical protein